MISYKVLKEENKLLKEIIERQTNTMRKASEIYGEAIKRKDNLINELVAEGTDQKLIDRIRAI